MARARQHHDRKLLRSGPVQSVLERYHVIFLAVHHQRSGRNCADREAADRGRDQHQVFGLESSRNRRGDKAPKRKSAQRQLAPAVCAPRVLRERQEIVDFATALVEHAVARTDSAEIQSQRTVRRCKKSFRQRLHNFVVERASIQRMRMRDQRHAAARRAGIVGDHLQPASGTVNRKTLQRCRFQMRRRWTMRPLTRCSSMISSMSLLST